ncbi:MAG: YiaA/YiaB family inner membrane protein [Planctomycetota bacterium]|nr:YiaA/YiaB family inner membrane protein [Planctomycetota bacterium]
MASLRDPDCLPNRFTESTQIGVFSPASAGETRQVILTTVSLLAIGLFIAAKLALSEQGFDAMSYTLCIFSTVAVQKNTREQVAVIALGKQHRKPPTL